MKESMLSVSRSPDSLFSIETILKAQWRSGDVQGAFKWVRRAMRLNPLEPGYYFLRGLLRQSVGMFAEAMEDFEYTHSVAKSPDLIEKSLLAAHALEEWQVIVLRMLISEDRDFRRAFIAEPVRAATARGFRFTALGERALYGIVQRESGKPADAAPAGIC
jgi:hypothetical protein